MKLSITQTDWNCENIAQKWTFCIKINTKNTEEKKRSRNQQFLTRCDTIFLKNGGKLC